MALIKCLDPSFDTNLEVYKIIFLKDQIQILLFRPFLLYHFKLIFLSHETIRLKAPEAPILLGQNERPTPSPGDIREIGIPRYLFLVL